MCWCFNVRDHTLTTEPIVPVHWQPETGAVREYNHFPLFKLTLLIMGAAKPFGAASNSLVTFKFNHFIILGLLIIGPYLITLNHN
jgi:hypothetical protein